MGFAQMPDGSGWAISDQGCVIVVTHESALAFARAVVDAEMTAMRADDRQAALFGRVTPKATP